MLNTFITLILLSQLLQWQAGSGFPGMLQHYNLKSKANIFSQAGFKTTQALVLLTKCLTLQYRKAQALFTSLPRKYLLQSNKLQDHAHLTSSKTST